VDNRSEEAARLRGCKSGLSGARCVPGGATGIDPDLRDKAETRAGFINRGCAGATAEEQSCVKHWGQRQSASRLADLCSTGTRGGGGRGS